MIDWVGGYGSDGFWILIFILLITGSILNAFPNIITKVIGLGLFMLGGIKLVGYIDWIIENTSNLPEYAGIFPMLFAAILILVVFKMSLYSTLPKKDTKKNEQQKAR